MSDLTDPKNRLAYLEFVNDQLTTELRYIDTLLRSIGFSEGIKTMKIAAEELMEQEEKKPPNFHKKE